MTSEPDIAIIGAGAAGIGAARHLADSGLSVVLLEALGRAGGRAFTQITQAGPLDLGCGWLHTAERNPWVGIAEQTGMPVDRRPSAWGMQYKNLGFSPAERQAAGEEYERWTDRFANAPPANDRASDALDPNGRWTGYIQALSGFINGVETEQLSARDFSAYDEASSDNNWRLPRGYGTLITASLPGQASFHSNTPVTAVDMSGPRVRLDTPSGSIDARAVIVTLSTNVLAGGAVSWPSALDPWRDAANRLPLGHNEKLFLEISGPNPFEPETHVIGNPRDPRTGSYYIRPFGYAVVECYLGGAGARAAATDGTPAAFDHAIGELAALFGNSVRSCLRPLIASDWAHAATIGGAYSHALPGEAGARTVLARPFENRLFFAGEATEHGFFSTAHGAYLSGVRAAREALDALGAGSPSA